MIDPRNRLLDQALERILRGPRQDTDLAPGVRAAWEAEQRQHSAGSDARRPRAMRPARRRRGAWAAAGVGALALAATALLYLRPPARAPLLADPALVALSGGSERQLAPGRAYRATERTTIEAGSFGSLIAERGAILEFPAGELDGVTLLAGSVSGQSGAAAVDIRAARGGPPVVTIEPHAAYRVQLEPLLAVPSDPALAQAHLGRSLDQRPTRWVLTHGQGPAARSEEWMLGEGPARPALPTDGPAADAVSGTLALLQELGTNPARLAALSGEPFGDKASPLEELLVALPDEYPGLLQLWARTGLRPLLQAGGAKPSVQRAVIHALLRGRTNSSLILAREAWRAIPASFDAEALVALAERGAPEALAELDVFFRFWDPDSALAPEPVAAYWAMRGRTDGVRVLLQGLAEREGEYAMLDVIWAAALQRAGEATHWTSVARAALERLERAYAEQDWQTLALGVLHLEYWNAARRADDPAPVSFSAWRLARRWRTADAELQGQAHLRARLDALQIEALR